MAELPEDTKREPSISEKFAIMHALNEDDVEVLKKFIEEGIDIVGIISGNASFLHQAASKSSNKVVAQLLNWGAQIEAVDSVKMTPLHHAASLGHVDTVALLVSSGANVTAMTESGNTPLHLAIQERRSEVVSYFIHDCKIDTTQLDKWWQDEIKDIFREAEVRKMQEAAKKQREQFRKSQEVSRTKETPIDEMQTVPAALLAQRPQIYQLNRIVVPRIASYWRVVLDHLNTDPSIIEELYQNNSRDNVSETCERAFQHWLDTDSKASWAALLSVLKQLKFKKAHKDVESEVAELPIDSSQSEPEEKEQATESWWSCVIL